MLTLMALRSMWVRRSRSLLTALGVGTGIALIIAIFVLSSGLKEDFSAAAGITEADLVATQRGLAGPLGGSIPDVSVSRLEEMEGVENASGFLVTTLGISGLSMFNLFGVNGDDVSLYLSGSRCVAGSQELVTGEIQVGKIAGDTLGVGAGDSMELTAGKAFTVAGVYETGNVYLDSGAIVMLGEAQAIAGREGRVTAIALFLSAGADGDEVAAQIEEEIQLLEVVSSPKLLETSASARMVTTTSWTIFAVAVVMACIGMMNTMSMSVMERMREIGLLRAVGWSRFRIVRMVLTESVIIGLLGFMAGVGLGVFAIWAVITFSDFQMPGLRSMDSIPFVIGLAAALLVAVLGGLVPAARAAGLSPARALDRE